MLNLISSSRAVGQIEAHPSRRLRFFVACSLLLFTLTLGCGGPSGERVARTRGYLLISIDTLRADHLGTYGYERPTSPFLDSLAERAVLFENAYAQLPGTLPSHMSIFTGLYPAEHGVYPPNGVLAANIETIAESFQRNRFKTAGFTEGGYVKGIFGFSRGFDEFDDTVLEQANDIERTFGRGLEFLKRMHGSNAPFFLFLHTYSVHDPYEPPEPFASELGSARPPGSFDPTGHNFELFNQGALKMVPGALEYYRDAYDASIRYMDSVLERFFEQVGDLGLLEDMTVIITSDHGEEFLEHGGMVHTQVFPESLHIPLMVLHPDLAPRRVRSLVETVDLAPTLREIAALETAAESSGESLVPLLVGQAEPETAEAYAEAYLTPSRTLFRQLPRGLFQYLEREPSYQNGGAWIADSVSFDKIDTQLHFGAYSFAVPRTLDVLADGELVQRFDLSPDRLLSIDLELPPPPARRTITLTADGCISPKDAGLSDDPRCLSFRVEELSLMRAFLYELQTDPLAANDLSEKYGELLPSFQETLASFARGSRSHQTRDLDAELVERLKKLGYL